MSEEVGGDLIEIHDPEVDVDRIVAEIRSRIEQRREELGYPRRTFPSFGIGACPDEPDHGHYDADLYYHLRKVNDLYASFDLTPVLAPSAATRFPLLGKLWSNVRREAHNLVLFYLARFARQEIALNCHLVSTLNRMTVLVQEQQDLLRVLSERCGLGQEEEA